MRYPVEVKRNCKCLFSYFNLTFYISQQQCGAEPSSLGALQGKNYITLGDCLILVWKSSNSYYSVYICNTVSVRK